MNNIYLVGMMGSGKSVTGRELAKHLKFKFVDLDVLIEQEALKSISEIFEDQGEAWFRDLEAKVLQKVSELDKQVVSTGGGVVLNDDNIERMNQTGTVIYLETSLPWLLRRVGKNQNRPLLKEGDPEKVLGNILDQRQPLYQKASQRQVKTDGKTANDVARDILKFLNLL